MGLIAGVGSIQNCMSYLQPIRVNESCQYIVRSLICPTLIFLLAAYLLNGPSAIFFLKLNFLLAAALCVNRCVYIFVDNYPQL